MKLAITYKEGQQRLKVIDAETGDELEGVTALYLEAEGQNKPQVHLTVDLAAINVTTQSASATATLADGRIFTGPIDQLGYDPTATALERLARLGMALDTE